ncbi:MAG: acetyl-CoA carboxylase biotin carboxyl carrier protein [Alphaproteobacteria bacterium]|nr:acetyl-CoA carboxylase biotin carboxyl carrier protein [Alphaproteobacteria bacterium]
MGDFDVDSDLVRKLAKLLVETGLGEIEYEADSQRIRVARPAPIGAAATVGAAADSAKPATAAEPAPGTNQEATHPGTVTSPMVGAVYLIPSPEDPPFITPGDSVTVGQTLMLIEAMKTFNEIKAERAGRVVSILVENGQPVEYGEPLVIIE